MIVAAQGVSIGGHMTRRRLGHRRLLVDRRAEPLDDGRDPATYLAGW